MKRLSKNQLRQIISESVHTVLNEVNAGTLMSAADARRRQSELLDLIASCIKSGKEINPDIIDQYNATIRGGIRRKLDNPSIYDDTDFDTANDALEQKFRNASTDAYVKSEKLKSYANSPKRKGLTLNDYQSRFRK